MKTKKLDEAHNDSMRCAGDAGDHEACTRSKCGCGCHIDPWPFEHAAEVHTDEHFLGTEEVESSNLSCGSVKMKYATISDTID